MHKLGEEWKVSQIFLFFYLQALASLVDLRCLSAVVGLLPALTFEKWQLKH